MEMTKEEIQTIRKRLIQISETKIEDLRESFRDLLALHDECLKKNIGTRHEIFCKILTHFDDKLKDQLKVYEFLKENFNKNA